MHRHPLEEEEEELQRQPIDEEEEKTLQTKNVHGQVPYKLRKITANLNPLRGGGQPLLQPVRAFFEPPRFGVDFSGVRVHTGERAAMTARELNAKAMTHNESYSQSFFEFFY